MDPFRTGKLVLFTVSYDRDWHYFEIPAYLLIGLFGVSCLHLITQQLRHIAHATLGAERGFPLMHDISGRA